MSLREAILAAQDLKSETVEVPEWGVTVTVQMLTGTKRNALQRSMLGEDGKPDFSRYRLRLVAACMVDESGQPVFGLDEVEQLGSKSDAAIDRVYQVAERLNAADSKAVEAAKGN